MIRFVFIDTALETIPKEIRSHPVILRDAKRRGKDVSYMLLDDSRHHVAMRNLRDKAKRGRPDILHTCLLTLIDSQIDDLDIFIHTYDNKVIWVNRETKVPRNYNRFVGLMEDLFKKRVISSKGEKLLEITGLSLEDVVREKSIVMKEGFSEENLYSAKRRDLTICIGCFQHGDFSDYAYKVFKEKNAKFAGFGSKALTALYVTYKTVCILESFRRIF